MKGKNMAIWASILIAIIVFIMFSIYIYTSGMIAGPQIDEDGGVMVDSDNDGYVNLSWSFETVGSGMGVYGSNSLALDSNDNPHISFYDGSTEDLKYTYWSGSRWYIETVDSEGSVGRDNSLALDSNGRPHISYYDSSNNHLKYAYWTGSSWHIETVDSTKHVGLYTSLALDSKDNPHISYCDYSSSPHHLKYAYWTGSSWNIETVDSRFSGWYTSLALDSNDRPHISYLGSPSSNEHKVIYAYWTGTVWSFENIADTSDTNSLKLDSNDLPHISYGTLKYTFFDGNNWNVETVEHYGTGNSRSLALDSKDNPHIIYNEFDTATDFIAYLKYAYWTGSSWHVETADSGKSYYNDLSIALDSNDNPHISYYDKSNINFKYAQGFR